MEREFNAYQTHRSMYTSAFNRFPLIQRESSNVRHFSTFLAHFGLPGYAPGTIAVNFTWIEREFNACQTPRSIYIYLEPFPRYSEILVENFNFFIHVLHLTPPYGVAPWTIAVSVTWIEREFNACQKPRSTYPSIFNRFPVIQAVSLNVRHLSTFFAHFVRPWDNRGKCHTAGKRIQCL